MKKFENKVRNFLITNTESDAAHSISHILRVVKLAKEISKKVGADEKITIPAAWLHDCVVYPKNSKQRKKSSQAAGKKALEFLRKIGYEQKYLKAIRHCIEAHSFSAEIKPETLEAKVVQDADNLDAIGAIGIVRCFLVGNEMGAKLYNYEDPFAEKRVLDDKNFSIDHFYTKLFKLKSQLNTECAREIAEDRYGFMSSFLEQLRREI